MFSTRFARSVHNFSTTRVDQRLDQRGSQEVTIGHSATTRDSEAHWSTHLVARHAAHAAAAEAMLFELYLTDGTSIVSYGEFARVGDRVVFSLVMGGTDQPRLHAATLPANAIDWTRTERQAASTRYQWARRRAARKISRASATRWRRSSMPSL